MKKIFLLFGIFLFSCSKVELTENNKEIELLKEFIDSKDFKRTSFKGKEVNLEKSTVEWADLQGKRVPLLNIYFENQGKIEGVLKSIKITDEKSENKYLPEDSNYAMLFIDLEKYSFIDRTGIIVMSDVNYGNYVFREIEILNGEKVKVQKGRIPYKILEEYGYFKKNMTSFRSVPSSCTGGSDKNVSWSECMDCLDTACGTSPDCATMKELTNILGESTRKGPLASLSMAVACIYISATH